MIPSFEHNPSIRRRVAIAVLVIALCSFSPGAPVAAADAVVLRRCLVLTRAVAYDANLRARSSGQTIVMGILRKRSTSSDVWFDTIKGMANLRMQGIPLRVQSIILGSPAEIDAAIVSGGVGVLLATPDIAVTDLVALRAVVKRRRIMTIGTTKEQAQGGVTLAVVQEGAKLSLMLNPRVGKEQGAAFSDELLRIAVVVP
jgi:hypothetical protein